MNKKQILEFLLESNTSISFTQVCFSLLMAVIIGGGIYLVYRATYRGTVYSKSFNVTLLLVTVITTVVMLIIGSNLALSLGMVGSLSIIRFRTAIKEPRDIAFLFWAIAVGLACGSEMYLIGLAGSAVVAVVLFVVNLDLYDSVSYLLVVRGALGALDSSKLEKMLADKKRIRRSKLRMRSLNGGEEELTYELSLKSTQLTQLVETVHALPGVESVNLVSYSGELLG